MILGVRLIDEPHTQGLNVFHSRDWTLPVEESGRQCFNYFDDALRKLHSDPQATRLSVPKFKNERELTELNTATSAALRSLPERSRPSAELLTLAVFENGDRRFAWTNLPAWANLFVESQNGDIFQLRGLESSAIWKRIDFQETDAFIHLSLFKDHFFSNLGQSPVPTYYRSSALITENRSDWLPSWSVSLASLKTENENQGPASGES